MTDAELAAWARDTYGPSRAEQGLPPTLTGAAADNLARLIDVEPHAADVPARSAS